MKIVILDNAEQVAEYGSTIFKAQLTHKPDSVFGLATGSTPLALYQKLIHSYQQGAVSFKHCKSFNLDEYLGLSTDHQQSYRYFMQRNLFQHIDINSDNTWVPNGTASNPLQACYDYENAIKLAGGIDLQLLGIGGNGHIGFNEPSSCLTSRTRIKTLSQKTIADNSRFFKADEYQPHLSITMGIGTIMDAKQILLIATGQSKADAIQAMVEGPLSASCPASVLQMHQVTTVIIDEAAASQLKNCDFYKHIEAENQALLKRLQQH